MVKTESQDVHIELAQALQEFGDEYAGIRPVHVRWFRVKGLLLCGWKRSYLLPNDRWRAPWKAGDLCLAVMDMDESWVDKVALEGAASARGIYPVGIEASFLSGVGTG
jgi:hypothetical protein